MTSCLNRTSPLAFAGGVLAAVLIAAAAQAQPQQQQQQQPAPPQQTTATYEDWTLRCATQAGPPPVKACEIVQSTHVQGQAAVLTQVAIGRPSKTTPMRMVVQVPIDVWLPTGIRVLSGDKDPGLAATFKRCVPTACLADVDLRDDTIKRFRTSTETGKLQFKDVNQKDVSLPLSFKGFAPAFDAMLKD